MIFMFDIFMINFWLCFFVWMLIKVDVELSFVIGIFVDFVKLRFNSFVILLFFKLLYFVLGIFIGWLERCMDMFFSFIVSIEFMIFFLLKFWLRFLEVFFLIIVFVDDCIVFVVIAILFIFWSYCCYFECFCLLVKWNS